jgi:hypothetical protein
LKDFGNEFKKIIPKALIISPLCLKDTPEIKGMDTFDYIPWERLSTG